ncbi:hypothetical protein NJF44_10805 [Pseudomonas guariconensis]|uniref:hypothetical protein n=1 Tax=Pseudomonas TaxID=286 RepID=UPI002096E0EA|nr:MULTISPECIES: hypothetical protein [Pseudomonas]MCO7515688.1 hypothetical protein [Pseudomonas putida]MCO7595081.1 hypothetical protein [Pseudomonas guariconensis]MCO7605719.1 hypothetical protein [Pseudomonas guariconensis]MCO7634151.1 hypothetical protein [Pseudomonas guariconensis]MCU7221039.1 hypothetical protein [Pseudomonas brassicacearum]
MKIFKENGSLLFDTEKITYGLLKSGYMSLVTTWPRLSYKSANLPPNEGSSYDESSTPGGMDLIHGFSVTGAIAPIVFINGPGISCGSSRSGNTTTFYYIAASTDTKYYYFDTMRGTLSGAGLKCYGEDGTLTFNSLQVPLDVDYSYTCPLPPAKNPLGYYDRVFAGGTLAAKRFASNTNYPAYMTCTLFVPIASGEFAVSTSFSRSFGQWPFDNFSPSGSFPARSNQQAHMDGCYGGSGGIYWLSCDAARTTMYWGAVSAYQSYFDIPTDKLPQALVIRTNNLPFPFN